MEKSLETPERNGYIELKIILEKERIYQDLKKQGISYESRKKIVEIKKLLSSNICN